MSQEGEALPACFAGLMLENRGNFYLISLFLLTDQIKILITKFTCLLKIVYDAEV